MSNYTNDSGTTIQIWPNGHSYTYRGDVHAPSIEIRDGDAWRTATADEHRTIKINVLAEIYGNRDILGCDSALVDDLIKAAGGGDLTGDLAVGFGYDEIRNLYADPSTWTVDECREYASEHGIDLPDLPDCTFCDGTREYAGGVCTACDEQRAEHEDDDSRHGWLTEARGVCQEYAQDNPREPYEWWRVSSWLCEQLHAIGEITIDNGYGRWWGRTCTGQGFIMDGTLQDIAARFVE